MRMMQETRKLKPELFQRLPQSAMSAHQRDRLDRFTEQLDTLFVLHEDHLEPQLDAAALRHLLNNPVFFPIGWGEKVFERIQAQMPERLTTQSGGRRISWSELGEHVAAINPPTATELDALGFKQGLSPSELRHLLQADPQIAEQMHRLSNHEVRRVAESIIGPGVQLPESPDAPLQLTAIGVSASNFWTCLESNLGWWGAVAVMAVAGAILIIGTATAPVTLPLTVWLVSTFGASTAVLILNCLLGE